MTTVSQLLDLANQIDGLQMIVGDWNYSVKATQQDEDKFVTKDDLTKYDNNLSLLESYDWLQLVEKPTFSASGNVIDVFLIKSDFLERFSIDYNVIRTKQCLQSSLSRCWG